MSRWDAAPLSRDLAPRGRLCLSWEGSFHLPMMTEVLPQDLLMNMAWGEFRCFKWTCPIFSSSCAAPCRQPTGRTLKNPNIITREELIISVTHLPEAAVNTAAVLGVISKGVVTHAITRLSNHCSVQVYCHYILTSDSRAVGDCLCQAPQWTDIYMKYP